MRKEKLLIFIYFGFLLIWNFLIFKPKRNSTLKPLSSERKFGEYMYKNFKFIARIEKFFAHHKF
jgi:hypothetical protein